MYKLYLDHVSYIYSQGTPFEQRALDDVCLGIRGGCITGIIGHTGSGKSTMMQLFNGITAPSEGKVLLDGYNINLTVEEALTDGSIFPEFQKLSKRARKKAIKNEIMLRKSRLCFRVGLVMQYPEYQLFEETVFADVAFGPRNMGLDEQTVKQRVMDAIAFTGLSEDVLTQSPFDLSGGQKRRVAIAGIMAMQPEMLVLDEPAAGLDPSGRAEIFSGIRKYRDTTGATVLIISHSMEDMAEYCDDIIVMNRGKVMLMGAKDEIFADSDMLIKAGLDIPQITRVMRILAENGVAVDAAACTKEQALAQLIAAYKLKS